jgi:polar amino acid transport system substrate-binding protein
MLCGLFFLAACSPPSNEKSSASDQKPLVVGMELAYRPFEMTDENGKPIGVSVDLALALGEHLDRPVEIRNIPFDGLIPALQSGAIDLIISSMTSTPERGDVIDFSQPYLRTGLCLLVGKDSQIESFEDLRQEGRKLAVKQGTTAQLYANENLGSGSMLTFDQEESCVMEVVQKKVDAFAYDQMSVYRHWNKHPNDTRALLKPFREEFWAVGVKKGNDALLQEVNQFLRSFREEGGFDELGEKWLAEEKKAFDALGYQFVF